MNEKALTVLEQYDLNIKGTYRTKGNYGCTTDEAFYRKQTIAGQRPGTLCH